MILFIIKSNKAPLIIALLHAILIISCTQKDPFEIIGIKKDVEKLTEKGVFIVNEGNFMFSNSSITYYDPQTKKTQADIFFPVNGAPLGDVAHSMTIVGNRAYITVNNSGKVYVINPFTFEYIGKITDLTSPRYVYIINDQKGYISDLYASEITVFNPQTLSVTAKINIRNSVQSALQHTSECFVAFDKFVFVNSWSFDNTILCIHTETDVLTDTIDVNKQPLSMVLDKNNKLWVLCDGGFAGSSFGNEAPSLVRIDAQTKQIDFLINFSSTNDLPSDLVLNYTNDTLLFLNRDVFRMSVNDNVIPTTPFIKSDGRTLYAIAIDNETNEIYLSDAVDYVHTGKVYRYSKSGVLIHSFDAGINPGFICFRNSQLSPVKSQ